MRVWSLYLYIEVKNKTVPFLPFCAFDSVREGDEEWCKCQKEYLKFLPHYKKVVSSLNNLQKSRVVLDQYTQTNNFEKE